MGLIFISHSSLDNAEATAMRDWLASEGWEDVFLDLDPEAGLSPGQRWRDELRKAGEKCSAIILLVSQHWAASKWCLTEFFTAMQLGKEIFPVQIAPRSIDELPGELTSTYQITDISTPEKKEVGLEHLRIGLQRAGLHPDFFPWPPENDPYRAPFRGLKALEEQDAAIFFGRNSQITKALDAIRMLRDGAPERMLVILGASGAGKSSFLRAGLLSRLARDSERFRVLPTLRPGIAPLTGPDGLGHAFGLHGEVDNAGIAAQFKKLRQPVIEKPAMLHNSSDQTGKLPPPTIVLPIDQAEELFTAGNEEATAVIDIISEAIEADRYFLILLTIRSDSYAYIQSDPLLSKIPRLLFDLPQMPAAALKEIIEGPINLPSVDITIDLDLTEQLIQDFNGNDTLPLLAFTLEKLIRDHCIHGNLSKQTYLEEMKGAGGAIRSAVEIAFALTAQNPALPDTRAELDLLAKNSFVPGLVRIEHSSAEPKRRVRPYLEFPLEARPLIDVLVNQRLLVSNGNGREKTIEISHEALFRHWRELKGWIAERREELVLSERVTTASTDWYTSDPIAKEDSLAHQGELLKEASKLLDWEELGWKEGSIQFRYIQACVEKEKKLEVAKTVQKNRQRRLRQWIAGLVATAAVITLLGAALVVSGQRNLHRTQSLMLVRTAQQFADEGDYLRALRLSILAAKSNPLQPTTAEALRALSSNAQDLKLSLEIRGHEDPVLGAIFSKSGNHILTWSRDETARIWDTATGRQIGSSFQHDDTVFGAIFSRNENRILTWSNDNTARIWDVPTGKQIGNSLQHDDAVTKAVFSNNESRILTWSKDNNVRTWDVVSGNQVGMSIQFDDLGGGAAFSREENRILTWSSDSTARIWDVPTGRQIGNSLQHDDPVFGAIFSRNEDRILTWSSDNTARIWDVPDGKQIGKSLQHDDPVFGAIFSKNENRILTWSSDGTARIWNATTGRQIGRSLEHEGPVFGAVFLRDDSRVLTWSDDKTARTWDAATGQQIGKSLKHDHAVYSAVLSNDESRILTWSGNRSGWRRDRTAKIWEASTGQQIGEPLKHKQWVIGAVFSRDGNKILIWSNDNTAKIWDVSTKYQSGKSLQHDDRVIGAVFARDGNRILTWSSDTNIRAWDFATGRQIGQSLQHNDSINGAVFSGDENRILTWGNDNTAKAWDIATGRQLGQSLQHDGSVNGALFSKDGSQILTWSSDHTARIWDAATGKQVKKSFQHDDSINGAIFYKDGSRILTWSNDNTAKTWDIASGRQLGQSLQHDDSINGAIFSKDESRILTWSDDHTSKIWDTATGKQVSKSFQHNDDVFKAIFNKDEQRILTWSKDRTAKIWDTATGKQIGKSLIHDDAVHGPVFSEDENRILTWSRGPDLLYSNTTAKIWDATTGRQVGKSLQHNYRVNGAVFSKDKSRILTWSGTRSNFSGSDVAKIWDASTGQQIGKSVQLNGSISGAAFSKDESRIISWSDDNTVNFWDVKWAMRSTSDPTYIIDICNEKLNGNSIENRSTLTNKIVQVGVRHIDKIDIAAAPILRGREGEDVCAPPPTTWETLKLLIRPN